MVWPLARWLSLAAAVLLGRWDARPAGTVVAMAVVTIHSNAIRVGTHLKELTVK